MGPRSRGVSASVLVVAFASASVCAAAVAGCSTETIVAPSSSGSAGSSGSSGDDGSSGTSGTSGTSGASGTSGTSGASGTSGTSGTPGPSALAPGKATRTIKAAGKDRSVIVVVPSQVSSGKLPLVIALHGNGDTHSGFIKGTTQLESLAASKGFVLAAPQGIVQNVTVGAQTVPNVAWDPYRSKADGNIALPLLEAIRDELAATGSIDTKRMFTFGYSQGGYMSFRFGMDEAAAMSCLAVLAAASPLGNGLSASAPRKIPVALQIGTNDSAIGNARATKTDLEGKSFPLEYREIAGAGHVPVPGDINVPLDYCLGKTAP